MYLYTDRVYNHKIDDYICEEENRDLVLMNHKWPVQPCVVLEEGEGCLGRMKPLYISIIRTLYHFTSTDTLLTDTQI